MSLFRWFSRKAADKAEEAAESSGLGHVDATVPFEAARRGRSNAAGPAQPGSAGNRKGERLERRELLYAVVRETMISAGVLSASYKFKVLSLDSHGVQYLIMMDLAREYVGEPGRLAEIESLIAQSAKSRFGILVTAVYWRVNEHVTAGLSKTPVPGTPDVPKSGTPRPQYEPLQADEVAAFKKALASMPAAEHLAAPGEIVRSGRRNPAPEPIFQNTELRDPATPLGGTQYGDLN